MWFRCENYFDERGNSTTITWIGGKFILAGFAGGFGRELTFYDIEKGVAETVEADPVFEPG
jgi:hypothetical protein